MLYLHSCAGVESLLVFGGCDAVLGEELSYCLQAFWHLGLVRGIEGRVERKLEHFVVFSVFLLEFNVGIAKEWGSFVNEVDGVTFSYIGKFALRLFCHFFGL